MVEWWIKHIPRTPHPPLPLKPANPTNIAAVLKLLKQQTHANPTKNNQTEVDDRKVSSAEV